MIKSLFPLIFFLFLLSSCEKSISTEYTRIISELNPELLKDYDRIIVIPGAGCGGCISDATSFVINEENPTELKRHVIFTKIDDSKIFMNTVGRYLDKKAYTIDDQNLLMHQDVASIYPQLLMVSNNSIIQVTNFEAATNQNLKFKSF